MNRRLLAATVSASALLALTACGSSSTDDTTSTPAASASASASESMSPSSSAPMSSSASPSSSAQDIVDTAVAAGSFKTLATALTAAELVDTLKGPGPFTVFAPTDDAFAKLPAGTLDTLLADPKGKLAPILTYHVVSGKVMAADVVKLNGQKVKTVNGAELTVNVDGSNVSLTDATGAKVMVTKTDIEASNGVIHVIDGVLLPGN